MASEIVPLRYALIYKANFAIRGTAYITPRAVADSNVNKDILIPAHHTLDPPLYALSWNLKDSHVFSGSFLYIKMKEKN